MELSKELKSQGWYLTDKFLEGLKQITLPKDVISLALDLDFRDIAAGALPTKRDDTLPGRIVLQVQRVRNISAPKANEESKTAPRLLQVEFSDGQNSIQALELEPVQSLSLNIPPGTKVHFKADRLELMQGFIVLKAGELHVLGGRVEALVEKWEFARTMLQYARSGRRVSGATGPPPWLAFGKKLDAIKETLPIDRHFKSLQIASDKEKEAKENAEFNNMRNEAIAEATKAAGAKKVFGGGGQQILDHNVKKILEKGYSEEDAKTALRTTNNNLERALYNLKRRNEGRNLEESAPARIGRGDSSREMGGAGGRRGGAASARDEAAAAKPAGNVSLFDFLTDKLPANAANESTNTATESSTLLAAAGAGPSQRSDRFRADAAKPTNGRPSRVADSAPARTKFENNISSSFAANQQRSGTDVGHKPRGGHTAEHTHPNERTGGNPRFNNGRESRSERIGGGGRATAAAERAIASGRTAAAHEDRNGAAGGGGAGSSRPANSGFNSRGTRGAGGTAATTTAEARHQGGDANNDGRRGGEQRNRNNNATNNSASNKGVHDKTRFNQKDGQEGNAASNNSTINSTAVSRNPFRVGEPSQPTTTQQEAAVNKLAESTAKLRINEKPARDQGGHNTRAPRQQRSQPQRSAQPPKGAPAGGAATLAQQFAAAGAAGQAAAQQSHQYSLQYSLSSAAAAQSGGGGEAKLPNGFTYDPSKIIGFQSKETNEYAMTLLRSQGLSGAMAPQQLQQQQVTASHHQQQQQQQQLPMQAFAAMPPPSAPYGASNNSPFMMPPSSAAMHGPLATPYGLNGEGWLWKVGDLCLAKYWDDSRYYEAQVTAVSDKTCVVFFHGYGNHEEVLKTDCLPVTDANHQPINSYAGQPGGAPSGMPGPMVMGGNAAAFHRGGSSQRRERQMYVPPHKRDN